MSEQALKRAITFFEYLSPKDIARMQEIYTNDAYFKDPFNEVHGLEPVRAIFSHMFVKIDNPKFKVLSHILGDNEAFLVWDFLLTFKGEKIERKIHGSSHLKFSSDGKIAYHRDYWDAAEELYEQLPILGSIMRWLKKRANA
jgi:steroid Delta-isomerase